MLQETDRAGNMAGSVSIKDFFERFGWSLTDQMEIPCENCKHRRSTHANDMWDDFLINDPQDAQCDWIHRHHSVDAVFSYDDPYSGARQLFLTAFKSYYKREISQKAVRTALVNLAQAVECATRSEQWNRFYEKNYCDFEVHGLLFIYNHDGEVDDDFMKHLAGINNKALNIRTESRIYALGPERISYLLNLLNDMDVERGRRSVPSKRDIAFAYPDLVTARPESTICNTGRIELLLGPWQVVFRNGWGNPLDRETRIYYASDVRSPQEFEFLFAYAFKSQLVQPSERIEICVPNASSDVFKLFAQAKRNFSSHFSNFPGVRSRLDQFDLSRVEKVCRSFGWGHKGMEERE